MSVNKRWIFTHRALQRAPLIPGSANHSLSAFPLNPWKWNSLNSPEFLEGRSPKSSDRVVTAGEKSWLRHRDINLSQAAGKNKIQILQQEGFGKSFLFRSNAWESEKCWSNLQRPDSGGTGISSCEITHSHLSFGSFYYIQPNVGEIKKILPPLAMHISFASLFLN